ncbi:MAG: O-antigen ligase family protein [Simkania sp.]|nr:O-antigen ligase family protein [Simkania sp.]MCB1074125.1 O-antigen ligase family protein [Simkania sp.]MCP5491051.1 O-antigen ligase family protein [Chlamydiales bacterium]
MMKKCLAVLFGFLLLGFPFESHVFRIFRPMARSSLHKFEAIAPFSLTIPTFFEKYIHFYLSDIAIVLVLCLILIVYKPKLKELFFEKESRYLTLFWFVAALSLLLSAFSRYYVQYFNLLNLGIIFCVFHAARLFFQDREKTLKTLLWGFALISLFECFVGVWQFFAQGNLGVFFLGEVPLHYSDPNMAVIPLTEKTRKLIEFFHTLPPNQGVLLRAYGTFIHPNIYGEYLSISLLVSYYLFAKSEKPLLRTLVLVFITAEIFALCLSFSRAAFLSWGIGTAVWLFLLFSNRMQMEKKQMRPLLIVIGGVIVCSMGVLFPQFYARGGFFNYSSFVQNSDSLRIVLQNIAFSMMKANPLLGIGYNCFVIAPGEFFPVEPEAIRTWTHNIYLLIGSETGLIGLLLFCLFIGTLIVSAFKHAFTPLSATLFAIFIGFLVVGLFDFYFLIVQSGKVMFFLFTGILTAQFATKANVLPSASQA